jgi:hypothetical protein
MPSVAELWNAHRIRSADRMAIKLISVQRYRILDGMVNQNVRNV